MALEELISFFNRLHPEMVRLVISLVVVVAVAVVYKIFSRSLSSVGKKLEFDPHVQNSLRLILRVMTIVIVTTTLFTIYEPPTTWFLGG